MARGSYYAHPDEGRWRLMLLDTPDDVRNAVREVLATRTQIGHPTLTAKRDDGSILTLSTDGERAFLVYFGVDGHSESSCGGPSGAPLVYDYEGHWSEAPSESTVSLATAIAALSQFVVSGSVAVPGLAFSPD